MNTHKNKNKHRKRSRSRSVRRTQPNLAAKKNSAILYAIFENLFKSTPLLSLPLMLLLFIASVDPTAFFSYGDFISHQVIVGGSIPKTLQQIEKGEEFKNSALLYVYIFTLIVAVFNTKKIIQFFASSKHIGLIFIVILFGAFHSIEPSKVFTNAIILLIGSISAILAAIPTVSKHNYQSLYFTVLIPCFLVHMLSIFVVLAADIDIAELILLEARLTGISYNPNTLAMSAVLGIWAAYSIILSNHSSKIINILIIGILILFFMNIYISRSGTSLTIAIILIVLGPFVNFYIKANQKSRIYYKLVSILAVISIAMAITLYSSTEELLSSFTDTLGKDNTLTGRTELWAIAIQAIVERPIFGWGYDTHSTVQSINEYSMGFNHYHNGYLDTLVAGGLFLFSLLLFNLFRQCVNFFRLADESPLAFPLFSPLVVILIYNLSEYTFVRPHSSMWMVYIATFAAVLFSVESFNPESSRKSKPKVKIPKKGKRHMRWA